MTLTIPSALALFLLILVVVWVFGSALDFFKGRRMRKFHKAQRLAAKLDKGGPGHNPRGRTWRK